MRSVVAITLVSTLATAAAASPDAALTVDVDGDGAVDRLRLEAPGQLVIERADGGGQLVPLAGSGPLTDARLSAAGGVVVASARLGGRWEAVALTRTRPRAALAELWRGPVGPAGDDDEYEQWVEAQPGGLVRFQTRADQRRCDGTPIELFRERWDAATGRFVPTTPVLVTSPPGVMTVTAVATGPGLPASWYRAASASAAAGATDASMLTAPRALTDGDVQTAWREGGPDDGRGTVWNYRATVTGGRAQAIRVVPGADAARNRPARLLVQSAGGAVVVDVPDPIATRAPAGQAYTATLPTPLDGCVSVALLEVHRGRGAARGAGTTAVAELAVLADLELRPEGAGPTLAAQVAAGGLAGDSAMRMLVSQGASAVVAIRSLLGDATGAARGRLLATLAQVRDPGVIPPLTAALEAGELPPDRVPAATATLAALGADGLAALATVATSSREPAVAGAAVRALAAVDRAQLIGLAGQGTAATRAVVARELGGLPVATLATAATEASTDAAAADLWRAVGLAGARSDGERAAAAAALVDALAHAGTSYQLRYRLFAAVTPLIDGAAIRTVTAAMARLPDSPPGHALARVATRGLARNPAPAARLALAALVGADDAGTRLDAIRGLALPSSGGPPDPAAAPMVTGDVTDAADRALVTALGGDAWPAIRQQAAAALGLRCQRPGPRTALDGAIDRDPHVPVRVEAVAARARCETPDLDGRLWALIDGTAPLPVRDRALAAQAERPGPTAPLLARFTRWRGQAFSDDEALRLAIRAATALGQRRAVDAGPALLAAARDTAFPELAAAAVQALGELGAGCPREAPALLASYAASDDQALVLAAKGALKRCR